MLIRGTTLERIRDGQITLQFRRWKRPTVKSGGTLLTSVGQLAIDSLALVAEGDLTDSDAVRAGFTNRAELLAALSRPETRAAAPIYRVELRLAGPDPRLALRDEVPDAEALSELSSRLDRWDRASRNGPWTRITMEVIDGRPGVRAGDLAEDVGLEKARFKTNVRKLKGLGLTESLQAGYLLSPRGRALLVTLRFAP